MSCVFDTLHADDTGYVVRCRDCGFYQLGFITSMLSLSEFDFTVFLKLVEHKLSCNDTMNDYIKNVIVETPAGGFCLILTQQELKWLYTMLQKADSEAKAQAIIKLFG